MKTEKSHIIDLIIAFAANAHGTQRRKYSDEPYIVHPVNVMRICMEYSEDISILAAALLHDVLEDTHVGRDEINGFLMPLIGKDQAKRTLKLVDELTDVYVKKTYPGWNRK